MHNSFDDLMDKVIVDLGIGTGMLSAGAAYCGCKTLIGIDADQDALDIAKYNLEPYVEDGMELILYNCLIDEVEVRENGLFCVKDGEEDMIYDFEGGEIDTVIMNPPFGTRKQGIDVVFLEKALEMANESVYSLHKTSTADYIVRKAERLGANDASELARLRYSVPNMYKFHKKKSADIEVSFFRFEV